MKYQKMKTWTCVLDLDGVTYKFIEAFESRFGDDHRDYVSLVNRYPDRKDEIMRWVNAPSTYARLEPMSLGVMIANYLMKPEQDCAVHIVTARPIGAQAVTRKRLSEDEVPFTSLSFRHGNKIDTIKSLEPDIVIDDIISVLQQSAPYFGVLSAQAYNETIFFPRISQFSQFMSIWQRMQRENVPNNLRRARMAQNLPGPS